MRDRSVLQRHNCVVSTCWKLSDLNEICSGIELERDNVQNTVNVVKIDTVVRVGAANRR